jgi:hypothetical protein
MSALQQYFSHDTNATRSDKLKKLRLKYGFEGLGIYWFMLEILSESDGYRIRHDYVDTLTLDFNLSLDQITKFIEDCLELGLFVKDDTYIWSNGLLKRMSKRDEKIESYREAGRRGAEKRWGKDEDDEFDDDSDNEETGKMDFKRTSINRINIDELEDKYKEPLKSARLLFSLIKQNDYKAKEPRGRWLEDIEKLHRIDDRSYEEINNVISYSQNDTFWKSNILSGKKLRQHFSKLLIKMNEDKNGKSNSKKRYGVPENQNYYEPL